VNSAVSVLRRAYDFHGIAVEVRADDARVLEAMDLRFRGFPRAGGVGAGGGGAVVLEFVGSGAGRLEEPAGDGRPVYETPHGELSYFAGSDVLAGRFGEVELHCEPGSGLARISAPAFEGRALYFATHPLASVALMELLERRRLYSLHAACLTDGGDRGVLLAGPSGSGKSTLTLALVRAGCSLLSDDIVFLETGVSPKAGPACPPVRALGFADAVGLTEYAADRFAELRPLLDAAPTAGFPKRLHRIEALFDTVPRPACVPVAVVFPQVDPGARSRLARLDGSEALLRLVPDVLLTDAAATQAHLAAIAALVEQVECFALVAGSDLERAAALVAQPLIAS
jgi:hypothetical protein